jgi:uncharacterized protein (UPF0216 family)
VHPDLPHQPAEAGYDKLLQGWLTGELRLVNSGLPKSRRNLRDLMEEERPSVSCSDGSDQLFKRSELRFLADLLDENEQDSLLLPILIEMTGAESEAIVLCPSDVELKVISSVLGMRLNYERPGRVRIYRPQLSVLRRKLKTTTQYAFSAVMTD